MLVDYYNAMVYTFSDVISVTDFILFFYLNCYWVYCSHSQKVKGEQYRKSMISGESRLAVKETFCLFSPTKRQVYNLLYFHPFLSL